MADEALIYANATWIPETDANVFVAIAMEKHAELIIRECFRIIDDYAVAQAGKPEKSIGESLAVSMKITEAAWKIKDHFGISDE